MYNKCNLILTLCLISILCSAINYEKKHIPIDKIENSLKQVLGKDIIYTKVPRGLIISVDENLLFEDCTTKLKETSFYILDALSDIIKTIPNEFVIEDHSAVSDCENIFENWEISTVRSYNIAEYFINNNNVSDEQIFNIGYADFMPLNTEISSKITTLKNRVDFVIIDFEAKR